MSSRSNGRGSRRIDFELEINNLNSSNHSFRTSVRNTHDGNEFYTSSSSAGMRYRSHTRANNRGVSFHFETDNYTSRRSDTSDSDDGRHSSDSEGHRCRRHTCAVTRGTRHRRRHRNTELETEPRSSDNQSSYELIDLTSGHESDSDSSVSTAASSIQPGNSSDQNMSVNSADNPPRGSSPALSIIDLTEDSDESDDNMREPKFNVPSITPAPSPAYSNSPPRSRSPSPTPTPSPSQSRSPSPAPTPSLSRSPSPTPSPSPPPSPLPPPEPEPEPLPPALQLPLAILPFGDRATWQCPICLDFPAGNGVCSTQCGHVYCVDCINTHLNNDIRCPACNRAIKKEQLITLFNFL